MKRAYGWWMSGAFLMAALTVSAQESKPVPVRPVPPTLPPSPPPVQSVATPASPYAAPRPSSFAQAPTATPAPRSVPPSAFPSAAPLVPAAGQLTSLKFDAESKEYTSKRGETDAPFTFWLTNVTSADVSITAVRTSCGCTVAKLPSTPWTIQPGQGGPIEVKVNLAGKSGLITKAVTVESTAGTKSLLVKVNIDGAAGAPGAGAQSMMNDTERLKNMQLALGDRQILFKNQDCAKCHADPAKGVVDGRQVYSAVCAVCHESHIRASMVPDLKTLTHPTDADYWRNWISYGRAGSMMPAFAQSEGGPLSEAQVNALVNYLVQAFPSRRVPGILQSPSAGPRAAQPTVVSPPVAVPAQ